MKKLLSYMFIVLLVSCWTARYHDISSTHEYAHVVGKKFNTLEELLIFGYSKNNNNFETIDSYVITEKPGIGGREVLSRDSLPIGSVIHVKRILVCTNCIFSIFFQIIVEVVSDDRYSGEFVEIIDSGNIFVSRSNGAAVELNPRLFEPEMD